MKILGTPKTPCRRSIFHVHLNHLSQLPFEVPLQPRLPPRVSRGTRHGAHSHHTQHNGEADTRGFGGGVGWDLRKGQKLDHVTEEAAAQAESRMFQRLKAVTLGTLRDSEMLSQGLPRRGLSCQLLLCALGLCSSTSFYAHASSLEDGSGCPGPSSPACCSLLVSSHPGLFPSTDRYMPKQR